MSAIWQRRVFTGSSPGAVMRCSAMSQSLSALAIQYSTVSLPSWPAHTTWPVLVWLFTWLCWSCGNRTQPLSSWPAQRPQLPLRQALGKPKPARWPAARMVSSGWQIKLPLWPTRISTMAASVNLDATSRAHQHHICRAVGKQPIGDNANDIVDLFLDFYRPRNIQIMHV